MTTIRQQLLARSGLFKHVSKEFLDSIYIIHLKGSLAIIVTDKDDVYQLGTSKFYGHNVTNQHERLKPKKIASLCGRNICFIEMTVCDCAALTEKGDLYMWGHIAKSLLAPNLKRVSASSDVIVPVRVRDILGKVINVKMEDHVMALTHSGQVYTWGFNDYGQVGNGTVKTQHSPYKLKGQLFRNRVKLISVGSSFSVCATDTEVFAWGCNEEGQLGIGSLEEKHTPTRVFRLHSGRFVKLASGYKHTIVCDNRGNVYTWGANGFGQIGSGNHQPQLIPRKIGGSLSGHKVTDVSCLWNATAVQTSSKLVFVWGSMVNAFNEKSPKRMDFKKIDELFLCYSQNTSRMCKLKEIRVAVKGMYYRLVKEQFIDVIIESKP